MRLQRVVRLLFQRFFEKMNVINPDSAFAIDDYVQGGFVRL
jgi:hypothetical protein